jgi:hypothetical protein
MIQTTNGGAIYILIKDLPEETAKYIQGESYEGVELRVLPEDYEAMVVAGWRSRGYKCSYCRQSMEYMKRVAIIKYIHVINPVTGVSIFLIPWFMLPRKKYPVQIYTYAAWYSSLAEEPAGACETAEVVKRLFDLETFDPSTVYRSKAQISRIFREHGENGAALSTQEPQIASTETIIDWVTEALEKQPTAESVKNGGGIKTAGIETPQIPAAPEGGVQTNKSQRSAVRNTDSGNNEDKADITSVERDAHRTDDEVVSARVLGNIPQALAEVKKPKVRVKYERRRRVPREHGERLRAEHKEIDFIEWRRLEMIRNEFTSNCKNIVLNAALKYHKLLN